MPPVIQKQRDCPVCGATHASITDRGIDWIACDKLTPTGTTRKYPAFQLEVIGAGVGVDQTPPRVENEKDKAARLAAIEAELNKAKEEEARIAAAAKLDDRVAAAEAELAALRKNKKSPEAP